MNASRTQADAQSDADPLLRLREPRSILDLVNYRMHLVETTNSARVTRICEGRYGITRREWRLLALLAGLGELAPSELARHASLDRSRTSKALMGLLAKGLVERRSEPGDRRRAVVALSAAGVTMHGRIFPEVRAINAELIAQLDDDDARTLARLLDHLGRRATELAERGSDAAQSDRRLGGSRVAWERGSKAPAPDAER